ncbi:hypothetical protein [Cellulomonas sp. PSBB021]|uniref:hypothetical protein n=1 Tax=Cellulomonas sp. PSBB021 TaxID=2003551 RepID=UPI0026D96CCB
MSDTDAARWRAERREAAHAHAEALRQRRESESALARAMITEFLAHARAHGPQPEPLRVRTYDGRARYRTPLHGWYLRFDETVAIDTDGEFYVLRTPRVSSAGCAACAPSRPTRRSSSVRVARTASRST